GWDEAVDLDKPPAELPDPSSVTVPMELRREIEEAMARYPDRHSAAIPALYAAKRHYGWISPEAFAQVAVVMQVTPAYLSSVATFYDMLETHPRPRRDVYVCTNISCSLRGADEVYAAMLAAADPSQVNVRSFECLGGCDIAPMASVDGEYIGPLETDDARRILNDIAAGRRVLEEKQLRARRCADPAAAQDVPGRRKLLLFDRIDEPGLNTLEVYERRGGYRAVRKALQMTPEEVLSNITDSGIRGRGGAGFQMGKKASF